MDIKGIKKAAYHCKPPEDMTVEEKRLYFYMGAIYADYQCGNLTRQEAEKALQAAEELNIRKARRRMMRGLDGDAEP